MQADGRNLPVRLTDAFVKRNYTTEHTEIAEKIFLSSISYLCALCGELFLPIPLI